MKVEKIMRTDVVTLQADEPLINAAEALSTERIRHLPVLEDGELVGILADVDVKHALPSPLIQDDPEQYNKLLNEIPVRRVMRCAPITASPASRLQDVVRLMIQHKIGAVPIVRGGRLVGIVTEIDVLQTYLAILEKIE